MRIFCFLITGKYFIIDDDIIKAKSQTANIHFIAALVSLCVLISLIYNYIITILFYSEETKVPNPSWKKAVILDWLAARDTFPEDFPEEAELAELLKAELLQWCK